MDEVEESVPLKERLDQDLREKTQNFQRLKAGAVDVGAYAEMKVQEMARTRIAMANLQEDLDEYISMAKSAADRGETNAEAEANGSAMRVAQELAQVQEELEREEQEVLDAQKEWGLTKDMIVAQSKQLQELSKDNMALVARARQVQMKVARLDMQESLLQLIPGDKSDLRSRALEKIKEGEARVQARGELTTSLWKSNRRELASPRPRVNMEGTRLLEEARSRQGYSPNKALPPPSEANQS